MPKLIVKNVDSRIDGEYDCEVNDLNARELHFVRLTCGLTAPAIAGGLVQGDAGLVVALVGVILGRHGKPYDMEALWEAQPGLIFDADEQNMNIDFPFIGFDFTPEQQPDPPEQPSRDGSESENDDEPADEKQRSGSGSRRSSAKRGPGLKATGEPG